MIFLPEALLHTQVPPLLLGHAVRLRHQLCKSLEKTSLSEKIKPINYSHLGQHDMPVLVLVVFVLVRVIDFL